MISLYRLHALCALALAFGLAAIEVAAQAPTFTKDQAAKGRAAYRESCATCHGAKLEGIHLSPSLMGERFDQMWRGNNAGLLSFHLRRMPPEDSDVPGNLSDETYTNILAYILISNGFEAGEEPLPSDLRDLSTLNIPHRPGTSRDLTKPVTRSPEQEELLENLPPVTDTMRANPDPNDWLQWGRTTNGHGYSPLKQINKETVGNLSVAWRLPIRPGASMPTPLVHDGVMYIHTFPETVLAIDASNGQVLWRYQYATAGSQKMGLGLDGDKVFVPTSDLHVVAISAKTGEVIWDHQIETETRGFQLRSAPMVVGNKVIQGVTASFAAGGGFVTAMDIETGEELWRFYTIARPDDEYGNTWNGLALEDRSGGSVWHQGTYDPETNLVYYGVAPTYDTGPLVHPIDDDSVSREAMYTNCTIALNPDTGELVWSYQHLANDQWDLDWAFERQLVDLEIEGEMRRVAMNVGKMGVLDAVDARTGEYLFSVDAGVQNVITAIDPITGKKTIDMDKWPDPDATCLVCPTAFGARSWPPTSYNPETQLLYLPLTEWCMSLGPAGMRLLTSGVGISSASHPDNSDGMLARLQAIDVANQKLGWAHHQLEPLSTSVLTTAGGLLFVGDVTPSLKAFDSATGEQLWQGALDAQPSSTLVTYGIGDKQYVAVVLGMKNFHIDGLTGSLREFAVANNLTTNDAPPGKPAIWVFALK